MKLYEYFLWPMAACVCAAAVLPSNAAGMDSYEAALEKVKARQARLDPVKSKTLIKNLVNLRLRLTDLNKGGDINARDEMTWSALAWAAYVGDKEIFDYLLSRGADPRGTDQYGISVFMRAIEGGSMDIVKYLVEECKCDPNEKDKEYGITALMRAATSRRNDIVHYLLEKKANVKARDKDGRNVLVFAATGRNTDIMETLVARGADLHNTGRDGRTLLMTASEKGNLAMVEYLVKKGAKVKAKTKYGKTALMYAAEGGYLDIVGYLLDHGADIKAKNKWGDTVLDIKTVDPAVKTYLRSRLKAK